jgi:hypothetical protein
VSRPAAPGCAADCGAARALGLVLALLASLATVAPALAQSMVVQVQVIYATNTEATGIDPALSDHAQSFSQFRYSAYRRLGGQTMRLAAGGASSMSLPGSRRLDLWPRGGPGEAASLKVAVYEGNRKLVMSDVRLVRGGQPVIVGGFRHQDGVLFLSIHAVR